MPLKSALFDCSTILHEFYNTAAKSCQNQPCNTEQMKVFTHLKLGIRFLCSNMQQSRQSKLSNAADLAFFLVFYDFLKDNAITMLLYTQNIHF